MRRINSITVFLPLFAMYLLPTDAMQAAEKIRFATFNASLYRRADGQLKQELASGDSASARKVAEIIQIVRPDVILLNEFDYDPTEQSIDLFFQKYPFYPFSLVALLNNLYFTRNKTLKSYLKKYRQVMNLF